jgi:predicted tellurium resistance membrane protein TerC
MYGAKWAGRSLARRVRRPLEEVKTTKEQEGQGAASTPDEEETAQPAGPAVPIGIVVARILIVTGMSFAAALAIFFLVGGFWLVAAAATVATVVFLFMMFAVERLAER